MAIGRNLSRNLSIIYNIYNIYTYIYIHYKFIKYIYIYIYIHYKYVYIYMKNITCQSAWVTMSHEAFGGFVITNRAYGIYLAATYRRS